MVQTEREVVCEENILLLTNPRPIPERLLTEKPTQGTGSAAGGSQKGTAGGEDRNGLRET